MDCLCLCLRFGFGCLVVFMIGFGLVMGEFDLLILGLRCYVGWGWVLAWLCFSWFIVMCCRFTLWFTCFAFIVFLCGFGWGISWLRIWVGWFWLDSLGGCLDYCVCCVCLLLLDGFAVIAVLFVLVYCFYVKHCLWIVMLGLRFGFEYLVDCDSLVVVMDKLDLLILALGCWVVLLWVLGRLCFSCIVLGFYRFILLYCLFWFIDFMFVNLFNCLCFTWSRQFVFAFEHVFSIWSLDFDFIGYICLGFWGDWFYLDD